MRGRRTALAGVAAAALSLSLVAAETSPVEESVGTASTSLLGADVTVTGLGDDVVGQLLRVATDATTADTPEASSMVVPLSLAGETAGESSASSDGDTSDSSGGATLGELDGALGFSVAPFQTTAEATAESAIASVEATTAELGALLGVLDLDLETPDITSQVTPEGADAIQGLDVSGFDLGLGDLGLGADVLGQLGLSQILDLLASLGLDGDLPEGIPGEVADIEALQEDLTDALGGLDGLESSIEGTLSQLAALDGDAAATLAEIAELEAVLAQLQSISLADLLDADDLLGTLADLDCDLDVSLLNTDLVQDAIDCVTGAISDLEDQLPTEGAITDLVESLVSDLEDLDALLAEVTGIVEDLLAELGGLDGLLDLLTDLLPDLLDDAAATDLVSVGAFDVGMNAVARDSIDDSSATVLCQPTEVAVLGQSVSTPDCSDGLSELSGLAGTLSDGLASVTDVLNSLPLAGLVEVGDLKLDLFGNLVEEVEEVDGMVTATAGFDVLDLGIPSVTLDPSAVTGPLGDLGDLPIGDLDQLIDLVDGLAGELDGLDALTQVVAGVLDPAVAAIGELDSTGALSSAIEDIQALIDGLDVGDLGSLTESISTPGLSLLIDPVSTASFDATAAPAPEDPAAPAPDPADDPDPAADPTLPTTGGGAALAAILALGGAAALMGRRRGEL